MAHGSHGHDDHAHHSHHDHAGQFRRLFWVMLGIAVPVVVFDAAFADLLGYDLPDWPALPWIVSVLGTVMYFWGGSPFLTGGIQELRTRTPGMMLLISLAITVAFLSSLGASVGVLDAHLDFWWELALLIVIMLLGHWLEMRSLAQTTSALDSLSALLPDTAEKVVGDEIQKVTPEELNVGDVVVVRPGGSVPADGEIVDGAASLDESMITGESRPVRREVGDNVVAGTIATDSGIRVEITALGEDTTLAGIQKLVSDAQSSTSRAQRLADIAAAWLFWFALAVAAITATVWLLISDSQTAVARTITVLIIACPHALGLAIPLVVSIATERGAKLGILIKDRLALESMRTIDTVLFDKTGTLTKGEAAVEDIALAGERSADEVLALAAAAESDSEHPIARAITRAAQEKNLDIPPAHGFESEPGVGVRATVESTEVRVGGPHLLDQLNLTAPKQTVKWRDEGATVVGVVQNQEIIGAIKLVDEIRPESREAVKGLHREEIAVSLITGDGEDVARSVSDELSIDRHFAQVRPEDKASKVKELQREGKKVAMVGDGVNDAPALAQADVGIAIGAGTDVAIGSAGVILASSDPRAVISVRQLSRATYRKMKQNLWWAAGYNVIAVPLAAGVLAPIGFTLPMSVGAIVMSASTVIVALNAQLLRKTELRPPSRY
ncbi:MAG TPA: heavy metal translocating P-type ATPase [Actinomycetales bacterium]|nr:heavy metal translocating P-type ATPase [Actinomycetales bacterium]